MNDEKKAKLTALPIEGSRNKGGGTSHEAYYYGFDKVGVLVIDALLASVAGAGCRSHHTNGWSDEGADGISPVDEIEEYARRAAAYIKQLEK